MWWWLSLAGCASGALPVPDATHDTDVVDTDVADTDPQDPSTPPFDGAALDAALAGFVADQQLPSASACVIGGPRVLWCGAAGDADVEAGRPATPDTPYLLASLSKAVVGVTVVRLLDAGLVDLDDPIEPVVGFPIGADRAHGAAVTWRTLVTHTSGIRDDWDVLDRTYAVGDSPVALGAFLEDYLSPDGAWFRDRHVADHAPGARAAYSNVGSALAAYAVERVTGQPFDDGCDTDIFAPLAMRDTHWHLADFPDDVVAVPYAGRRGALTPVPHYGIPDYPDGQLRSSARDVATLLAHVAGGGGEAVPPGAVPLLLTPPLPAVDALQGVLWYGQPGPDGTLWGHNGGEVGASTDAFFDPETGAGFVLLVNAEPPAAAMVALERTLLDAASRR